jgi:hypothetical protein
MKIIPLSHVCKLCHGSFPWEEVVINESDNAVDIGPVCVYCLELLNAEFTSGR